MVLYGLLDGRNETICYWIGNIKLYKIILLVFFILVLVPLVTHYYLSNVETSTLEGDIHRTRAKLEALEDFSTLRASDLKMRIEEMLRIKSSVSFELRNLEAKKQALQSQVTSYNQKIEDIKSEMVHQQMELDRLKISVQQAQFAQQEAVQRNTPELAPPVSFYPNDIPQDLSITVDARSCSMYSCWNYTRCSITSGFPVYMYKTKDWEVESFLGTTLDRALSYNPHMSDNPYMACAYIVLVGESQQALDSTSLSNFLKSLPYWGGDGRNHILLNLARRDLTSNHNIFSKVDTGRASIVQSSFHRSVFRPEFDLIAPPVLGPPGGDVWHDCPYMLPARRKYLLSFQGQKHLNLEAKDTTLRDDIDEQNTSEQAIVNKLMDFTKTTNDMFLFHFTCQPPTITVKTANDVDSEHSDWMLCGTESTRAEVLRQSTFALILAPPNQLISSTLLQARLYEALKSGAVPVIIGGDQIKLPFHEFLSWKKAVLSLPKARITELHYLLRSIPDNELLLLRRQGRMLWETYLSSLQCLIDTILANYRDRLGIPAKPVADEPSPSVFNETFVPLKTDAVAPEEEPEESLGPLEPPYASPTYRRNYTYFVTQSHEIWNEWGNPFHLYPYLPFDPVLPSDAKFTGSAVGFRPIGKGAGGAGKEFSESLGGNQPREQFTIVMLTYEREQVLLNSISRLYGLPYLNKVVVVWNSPRPPLEDLRWPDIGVPVQVVRAKRNSLNNRFLPYEAIETEAILSVDDDAHLRHDEIMFGFRVWREQRDRVVGFPGRYHAWDLNNGGWLYNSNYSCELSMVLTGAAFFHKYYTYLYSNWLPQAVRDKVDQYMNCEDIAMNFLVSHFTRKPPVKVTSRWTFRCPGCPVSLSEDDTHFQERHKCIQFFTEVFGYTPLLNTQFRVDSILFKTRIPHDKQKCFKFI